MGSAAITDQRGRCAEERVKSMNSALKNTYRLTHTGVPRRTAQDRMDGSLLLGACSLDKYRINDNV